MRTGSGATRERPEGARASAVAEAVLCDCGAASGCPVSDGRERAALFRPPEDALRLPSLASLRSARPVFARRGERAKSFERAKLSRDDETASPFRTTSAPDEVKKWVGKTL